MDKTDEIPARGSASAAIAAATAAADLVHFEYCPPLPSQQDRKSVV